MLRLAATAAFCALSVTLVHAAAPTCGPGNNCPQSAPCCSQYGQCGVGAYCLGGCDPLFSHQLDSCVPAPVCKSGDYKLENLNDVQDIASYLGDASSTNWVSSGRTAVYNGDSVLLIMAPDTAGTLMASTHYVWYGKISATLSTSRGQGVVTAFIMMSDVKDEIDFEFIGPDLQHAQSNFYSQGIPNYNNELNLAVNDTFANTHTYTVDWNPDSVTWSIDSHVLRTLNRADTWNATSNRFDYPQTPSRIMLSIWPAGLATNAPGTIAWAGGLIDWNSPLMTNGYYYARVLDVNVDCYNPPAGAQVAGSKSYIYTGAAGTNSTVQITNDVGILASLYATGENRTYNPQASSAVSSSSSSSSATAAQSSGASQTNSAPSAVTSTDAPETVPGISGAGTRGDGNSQLVAGGTTAPAAAAPTSSSGSSSGGGSGSGSGGVGFVQGVSSSSPGASQSGAADPGKERVMQGSLSAVLVAILALVVL